MAVSQNGWRIVGQSEVTDPVILGTEFPNGWLEGDVDVVFRYLVNRLHREVEPILVGGCWGWYVKVIEGSATPSNHGSGTAIDYNAPAHPMGVRNTYAADERGKIHDILSDMDGVIRWGGDYENRPDDMHFEIVKNAAAVKALADRIRGEDLPVEQKTFSALMNGWAASGDGKQALTDAVIRAFKADVLPAPGEPADNPTWALGTHLRKIGEALGLAPQAKGK